MADPSSVTVVIPAFNEAAAIGAVVESLRGAANWREMIVVDDGSTDQTADVARRAGAKVVRHPYNMGNGASVKSGIREASGLSILIMDGDGQHTAAEALRLVAHLGEYDLVVGARAANSQASAARNSLAAIDLPTLPVFLWVTIFYAVLLSVPSVLLLLFFIRKRDQRAAQPSKWDAPDGIPVVRRLL